MAEPLQAQLQQQLTNAVDRALTGCPREDFCSAFAVAPEHRPLLEAAASQAYEQLRSSTLVRARAAARGARARVRPPRASGRSIERPAPSHRRPSSS